jgi:hypothetical protein
MDQDQAQKLIDAEEAKLSLVKARMASDGAEAVDREGFIAALKARMSRGEFDAAPAATAAPDTILRRPRATLSPSSDWPLPIQAAPTPASTIPSFATLRPRKKTTKDVILGALVVGLECTKDILPHVNAMGVEINAGGLRTQLWVLRNKDGFVDSPQAGRYRLSEAGKAYLVAQQTESRNA